jgi:hypothetical protein
MKRHHSQGGNGRGGSPNAQGSLPFQPFEIEEGTPTITFTTGDQSLTLAYHHFLEMRWEARGTRIAIGFSDYQITIEGTGLRRLWREIQLFNVREIEECQGASGELELAGGQCLVGSIAIRSAEEGV